MAGVVRRVTYVGDLVAIEVAADGAVLVVEAPTASGEAMAVVGEAVMVSWRARDELCFPG